MMMKNKITASINLFRFFNSFSIKLFNIFLLKEVINQKLSLEKLPY